MAKTPQSKLLSAHAEPTFDQIAVGNYNLSYKWEVSVGDIIWLIKADDLKASIDLLNTGEERVSWHSALDPSAMSSVSIVDSMLTMKSKASQKLQVEEDVLKMLQRT